MLLITIFQVMRLVCRGFIFALHLNHTMSDGLGLIQFLTALGEMARGPARPSVRLVWEREILRPQTSPIVKSPHYKYYQIKDKDGKMADVKEMRQSSFFFGPKEIESVKRQEVGQGKCSTFEVLSACLWRSRTRDLQLLAEQEVRFIFTLDGRVRFDLPIPENFYKNAIILSCAKTTARELATKPLSFAVKLIRQEKNEREWRVHVIGDRFDGVERAPSLHSIRHLCGFRLY